MSQAELLSEVPPAPFQFQNHLIRTQLEGETLWFVAKDVCAALGIDWSGKTLSVIPDSWQSMGKFPTLRRGQQAVRRILEPAVYKLAFRSNKPEADAYTNWIASEVVPSIRKTGRYEVKAEPVGNPDRLTDRLSTPASRKPLRALVHAWAQVSGVSHTALWPQVKAHFQLSRIDDLPESWIPDALAFVQEKIDQCGKALPPAPEPEPARRLTVQGEFPADMGAGRKDALRKIRSIMDSMLAAREVVRMFCYPQPATMDKPRFARLAHNARHDFYAAALDCLSAAHEALEAGYRLEHLDGRG